jgi:hypothetical protein
LLSGISFLDPLSIVDWLRTLSTLLRRCPGLLPRVSTAAPEFTPFLRSADPRSAKYAAKILTPIAADTPHLFEPLNVPGLALSRAGGCLMAFLRLLEALTRASVDVCRQCTAVQLFSFAGAHELGFRGRATWIAVLANVVAAGAVPADAPSRKAIAWVVETCLDGDDEEGVLPALRVALALAAAGFAIGCPARVMELAEQHEMPGVAVCARAIIAGEAGDALDRR